MNMSPTRHSCPRSHRASGRPSLHTLLSPTLLAVVFCVSIIAGSVSPAAADLISGGTTTFPHWSFAGLTVDINVTNVYGGVIIQVWMGANACGSPETAVPVASLRVPSGTPVNTTATINVPSNSVSRGYYSVCAADPNTAATTSTDALPEADAAERERMAFLAVEENVAFATWVYEQVGELNVVGLLHTPTRHDVNALPGVFSLQLDSPDGTGAMEHLCTSTASCDTPLTSAARDAMGDDDMAYLLSILRVSLFYMNPAAGEAWCPGVQVALANAGTVPQADVVVTQGGASTGKWRASASVSAFPGIQNTPSGGGASSTGSAAGHMSCSGPTVVIAPFPGDDAYQGHTLAGFTIFSPVDEGSNSSSSSSSSSSESRGISESSSSSSTSSSSSRSSSGSSGSSGSGDPIVVPAGVFPTSLVRGRPQAMRSLRRETGVAAFAADPRCTTLLSALVPIRSGVSVLSVPQCVSNPDAEGINAVYYCEGDGTTEDDNGNNSGGGAAAAVNLQVAGEVTLLSLYNCAIQQPENVVPITHLCGVPLIENISSGNTTDVEEGFGVTPGFALEPFLSMDRDCTQHKTDALYVASMTLLAQRGYVPSEAANASDAVSEAAFYVCLTSPDGTLNFTTDAPTVRVTGAALSPRVATVNVATPISMWPAVSFPQRTYIAKDCATAGLPPLNDLIGGNSGGSPSSSWILDPDRVVEGGEILGEGGTASILIRPALSGTTSSSTSDSTNGGGSDTGNNAALLAALGLYSVCTPQQVLPSNASSEQEATDAPISFAYTSAQSFLAIAPPTVRYITAPVVDSVMCAEVTVPGGYYSVVPGIDSAAGGAYEAYQPYYASEERGLYLMRVRRGALEASTANFTNLCAAGHPGMATASSSTSNNGEDVGAGEGAWYSDVAYAADSGNESAATVCFNTTGLAASSPSSASGAQATDLVYLVCAGTPSGAQQQPEAATPLSVARVAPSEFVASATTAVSIPEFPNTDFILVSADSGCDAVAVVESFTTNATGGATITANNSQTGEPLSEGVYNLCFHIPQFSSVSPWQRLRSVLIVPQPTYDVAIRTFVTRVPAVAQLGTALQVSYLLPGFFADTACSQAVVSNASFGIGWEEVEGEWNAIRVTATFAPTPGVAGAPTASGPVYLCAVDPVDGSRVAFPTAKADTAVAPQLQYAEHTSLVLAEEEEGEGEGKQTARAATPRAVGDDLLATGEGIRVTVNPMIVASMHVSTCVSTNVYFRDSTGTEGYLVSLVNGPCCVSSSPVVQQGVSTGLGYRTFFVNDSVLERYSPQRTFSVCTQQNPFPTSSPPSSAEGGVSAAAPTFAEGLCYTPGNITFFVATPSQCATAPFGAAMPVLGIAARENILGTVIPKKLNIEEVTDADVYAWTVVIVLGVVTGVVWIALVVFVIVCAACTPKTRPIAEGEKEKEAARATMWRNDSTPRFGAPSTQENPTEALRAMLLLSPEEIAARINLRLDASDEDDTANTPPRVLNAQRRHRSEGRGIDEEVVEVPIPDTVSASVSPVRPGSSATPAKRATVEEGEPAQSVTPSRERADVAMENTSVPLAQQQQQQQQQPTAPSEVPTLAEGEDAAIQEETVDVDAFDEAPLAMRWVDPATELLRGVSLQERRARRRILEAEDDHLLTVLEEERRVWRDTVSREGKHLRNLLQEDPFWATRQQTLEEVNERALRAVLDGEQDDESDMTPPRMPPLAGEDEDAAWTTPDGSMHDGGSGGLVHRTPLRIAKSEDEEADRSGKDERSASHMSSEEKDRVRGRTPERRGQTGWPTSPHARKPAAPAAAVTTLPLAPLGATALEQLAETGIDSETTKPGNARRPPLPEEASDATGSSEFSRPEGAAAFETSDGFSSPSPGRRARRPQGSRTDAANQQPTKNRPGPHLLENLLRTIRAVPASRGPAEDEASEEGRPMQTCVEASQTSLSSSLRTSSRDDDGEEEEDTYSLPSPHHGRPNFAEPMEGQRSERKRRTEEAGEEERAAAQRRARTLPLPPPPTTGAAAPHTPPPLGNLNRSSDGDFSPASARRGDAVEDADGLQSPGSSSEDGRPRQGYAPRGQPLSQGAMAMARDRERVRQMRSGLPPPPPANPDVSPSRELSWSPPSSH